MVKEKRYRAWHFVNAEKTLGYDATELTVEPGYVYSIEPHRVPQLCNYGMHGSLKAFDALSLGMGPVACLVDIWGDVRIGDDKLVGRHREVLAMCDATKVLHRFACWCVRETPLPDGRKVWNLLTDERSRRAVEVKEAWIDGLATDAELAAAWFAAQSTLDAAWDAALDAAWDAALDAARAAQSARAAARAAALDARDAALDAQNTQLEKMLLAEMGR